MVFCGKASLSCKNCRIRRIKCNQLEPECSQCTRAGKKCPGYRDQLSLMFRDETDKVRKKFQEEVISDAPQGEASSSADAPAEDDAEAPSTGAARPVGEGRTTARPTAPQIAPTRPRRRRRRPPESGSVKDGDGSQALLAQGRRSSDSSRPTADSRPDGTLDDSPEKFSTALVRSPQSTPAQRGFYFYIEQYVLGPADLPNEPICLGQDYPWLFQPATNAVVTAIGLAGLANLTGDRQLRMTSSQNYVSGLKLAGQLLPHTRQQDLNSTARTIVLLAMFEVVRGADGSFRSANEHVMGATALMRQFLPSLPRQAQPFRNLMQYCFSLLIPCYASGTAVPSMAAEYVTAAQSDDMPDDERAMGDLLLAACDVVNLSSYIRHHVLVDGDGVACGADLLVQTRQLDNRLAAWERTAEVLPILHFDVCSTTTLPPEVCFHGRFHRYTDLPTARIWCYYRWARILVNELQLHIIERCPQAAKNLLSDGAGCSVSEARAESLGVIYRLAEDTLVSTPTFWRHPNANVDDFKAIATPWASYAATNGTGSIGLLPLLFHLQAAGCAPGVPNEYWQWTLSVVDTVWRKLGMWQAQALADLMRAHHEAMQRQQSGESGPLLMLLPADRMQ